MSLIYSKLKAGVTKVKIEIVYSGTNPVLAGYEYQLKEKNSNAILDDKEGDNQNSQDDIYWLPTPITDNIGRKVLLTSKIAALDKDAEYEVKMKVLQDDINTDTLISVGKVRADGEAALSFDIIKFI